MTLPYSMTSFNSKNYDPTDIVDTSSFSLENFSFCTKSVILRFKKPNYVIDDIFFFKMELEGFPEIESDEIFFECELLHSPIFQNNDAEKNQEIYENVFIFLLFIFFLFR